MFVETVKRNIIYTYLKMNIYLDLYAAKSFYNNRIKCKELCSIILRKYICTFYDGNFRLEL